MTASEFMAIAPMFTGEDVTCPAFNTPFRHSDHLFATDGRIALAYDGLDIGGIQETSNETQKHIGDRLINDHFGLCKQKIASGEYRRFSLEGVCAAMCAAFANVEPEMMWLRMNLPDDDPDEDFEPDSVRWVQSTFTSVIMANKARSVVAGYYASLIVGLMANFAPVDSYSSVNNPHDMLYFSGPGWRCVLMPRLVKSCGVCHEWNYYGGCAIADAMTGKLVWGRDCAAVLPDMDTLRKAVAE